MKKRKQLFLIGLCTLSVGATVLALNGSKNVAINALECTHDGNHYAENAATTLESGNDEFYVCCKCHEIFKQSAKPDGTWKDATVKPDIAKGHAAYIEPTVTASDVISMIDSAGASLSKKSLPTYLDKLTFDKAKKYKDVYLTKENASEDDITNMDVYRGVKHSLDYSTFAKAIDISGKQKESPSTGDYNFYAWSGTAERNLVDDQTTLHFSRITLTSDINKYVATSYFNKEMFGEVTTDLVVYVRTSVASTLRLVINGKNFPVNTTTSANVWTAIRIPFSYIKALQDAESKGLCYINNTGETLSKGTTIEVSDFYTFDSLNLENYNVLSNEGYSALWQAGGLTGKLTTDLHNEPLFYDVKEPDFHPDYRSYFLETAITNASGAEKKPADLLVDNSYYGGLYFGIGTKTFNKTVSEMLFMVYSNEEVDIEYANIGDIVRKGQENNAHDTVETKLYKGWNAIHIDFSKVSSTFNLSGHFFQLVPTVWSTTLELTMTAAFYTAAE